MPALHSPPASALRRRPAFCVPWKQTSPMAKSRSKVSRQPAKKSSKAAARRTRAAKARLSRPAKPVATARKVTAKPVVKPAANAVVKPTAKAAAKKGQWVYALRRRQGRRPRRHAQSARRQGREPRRDGASRPAGAARLHHHHRGLHLFLRERQNLSEGFEAAGRSGARARSAASPARNSATAKIRCSSRCARARAPRCRA